MIENFIKKIEELITQLSRVGDPVSNAKVVKIMFRVLQKSYDLFT